MNNQRILFPDLPFRLRERAAAAARDGRLLAAVTAATVRKDRGRQAATARRFGTSGDRVRRHLAALRRHTLDHLDVYLRRFIDRARANGTHVHFAGDAAEAREHCLRIAAAHAVRRCVKSKSMVTEEIALAPALLDAGIETVETDLGEFIVQLDRDAPAHIVTPIIHKDREQVARTFVRELQAEHTTDPAGLAGIARGHLRAWFARADLGVSGANFLVAETGSVVLCSNEGNTDLVAGAPPVHIVLAGIEKIVPDLVQVPAFLKMLARSSTGQEQTVYTALLTGPRRAGEHDGPNELHVVLLDAGRIQALAPPSREILSCIRCGACLNACPVFRKVGGGHAYGAVYTGPIGAVLTPQLLGLANYPDLPHASSLCGACAEACPVHIDLPRHLVRLRAETHRRRASPVRERAALAAWAWLLRHPRWYRATLRALRWLTRALATAGGGAASSPYEKRVWWRHAPGIDAEFFAARDLPGVTVRGFREWWAARVRARACARRPARPAR